MIKSLYIKNFILIDELTIDFKSGINVFTGETGAGKSIILRAIDIVFGAKVNRDVIKNPEKSALVELTLNENNEEIIISREITQTGTKPRIQGAFSSLEEIKKLREELIDIHSQHQTYNYLSQKFHIELLDNFIIKENLEFKNNLTLYKEKFEEYKNLENKINNLKEHETENKREIDFLTFQINEIEEAEILDEEEENLKSELEVLENVQTLKDASYSSYWALNGEDDNILDALDKISSNLISASRLDKNLESIKEDFLNSVECLKENAKDLRNYEENLNDDENRLDEINERLSLIEKLKRKYVVENKTLNEVLTEFKNKLDLLQNSDNNLEFVLNKFNLIKDELENIANNLSEIRHKKVKELSNLIEEELHKLELKYAKFEININKVDFNKTGTDNVEFLITTNVSQPLSPLIKVASGGELSRVMLAIKIVFRKADKIKTIIFDEIDTGISGSASNSVAESLKKLSSDCQILIITHQAIIASSANQHFEVTKEQNENDTKIKVENLDFEKRAAALAKMAGGMVTENTLSFAKELLEK